MSIKLPLSSLLLCGILSLGFRLIAAEGDSVPADFSLCAQYSPGFSASKPWKVMISADGKAQQKVDPSPFGKKATNDKSEKTSTLTLPQLRELVAAVRSSKFFALKKRYSYDVTDNPTLTLRVRMDGSSQEVEVYAPGHLKDDAEVRRFMKVWNAVLKNVPSPNPWQKPE
jgi:hypothetical protein